MGKENDAKKEPEWTSLQNSFGNYIEKHPIILGEIRHTSLGILGYSPRLIVVDDKHIAYKK